MVVARHHGSVASSTNSSFTSLRTTQQYTALNTSRAFTSTGPFIGVGSAATSENLWTARKGSSKLGLSSEDISAENVSNASSDGWQGVPTDTAASTLSVQRSVSRFAADYDDAESKLVG